MGKTAVADDQTVLLIDEIRCAERDLARAQAGRAGLMVQFADARKELDRHVIGDLRVAGSQVRYRPGEFAATEIAMAVTATNYVVRRTVCMTRRLQSDAPDVWDAWIAGDINEAKAVRIDRALRRLVREDSKRLLNLLAVPVAIEKTPELLGRWLNRFVARVEPDEQDERIRRSIDDRYVSVRPDIDGVSFLSACLSAVDATSVDRVLSALAGVPEPGDDRTKQQRRADALVDVLLGRVSNGWHAGDGDEGDVGDGDSPERDLADGDDHEFEDHEFEDQEFEDQEFEERDASGSADVHQPDIEQADVHRPDIDEAAVHQADVSGSLDRADVSGSLDDEHGGSDPSAPDRRAPEICELSAADARQSVWDAGDWELPASAFRPVEAESSGRNSQVDTAPGCSGCAARLQPPLAADTRRPGRTPDARPDRAPDARPPARTPDAPRPVVTIGVVVSIRSLFGLSDRPGELADRSAPVPASVIRELAARPGTLFHRLLTDDEGQLLDVTEMGRFPSRKLGLALRFRDGTCTNPVCHVSADRCDLDHIVPAPEGPTTAANLDDKCRHHHRAKTHAGFRTTRDGGTTTWTTPTGHAYRTRDDTLPVEAWPP